MIIHKKILTMLIIGLLLVSTVTILSRINPTAGQSLHAVITGNISDRGVDTNGNGKYDFLEVTVEINVTEPGQFMIQGLSLMDEFSDRLDFYTSKDGYLDAGLQYVDLSFAGSAIYGKAFNPNRISEIDLLAGTWPPISSVYNIALSRVYYWTEFDVSAYFTGNLSDRGVDTNDDGYYNYLEIGVEINVTEAGTYEISVGGLEEVGSDYTRYFYDYTESYILDDFAEGIYTVYFNFSGIKIANERFNPTNIAYAYLYDATGWLQINHIQDLPLSTRYDHTLFDHSLNDIQVNFDVYPNATLGLNGVINYTNIYPQSYGPFINATVDISTSGDVTTGSATGTLQPQRDSYTYWPYDSTTAHLESRYNNDMLNVTLAAMTAIPPDGGRTYPFNSSSFTLNTTYSNGKVDVDLSGETVIPPYNLIFPLNVSDFTVRANSAGEDLTGNITFHAISDFPLADVVVYFNGNSTYVDFTGNINVLYVNFYDLQLNASILDDMIANFTSQIPGQGPDSLYNKTMGLIECTQLDLTKTPWLIGSEEVGANVEFSVTTSGNYTALLAKMLYLFGGYSEQSIQIAYAAIESTRSSVQSMSLLLDYYHDSGTAQVNLRLTSDVKELWQTALQIVPPAIPPEVQTQIEAALKIANVTADAIEDFSMNASYSSSELKFTLYAMMLANMTRLRNDAIPMLSDLAPPEIHDIFESFFNATCCTLASSTVTLYYVNGTCSFDAYWSLQGDFKGELNHATQLYIAAANASSPLNLTWMLRMLSETEIDINSFHLECRMGMDWTHVSFDGLILKPQKDDIDFIKFRLRHWLDLAADANQLPQEFDKLKITITGKSDGNQTILLDSPTAVPDPSVCSPDYKTMMWENTSLTSLRDLLFLIAYEGRVDYNARTFYVPIFTNSTVTAFGFDPDLKKISFTVSGTGNTGFCNVTLPKILLNATSLDNWTIRFDDRQLSPEEFSISENTEYVFVYLNYTHSDHVIDIVGTEVPTIPELQTSIILLIGMAMTLASAIAIVKRKKTVLGISN
jgi:hypothetical protein